MSVSRRLFLSSVLGFAFLGQRAFAQEKSPLSEILSGISDRAMRDFVERHDKDGHWDGKYYYDRRNNKRYTKDEWRKELEWRFKEEKAGRDWHQERYGKPRRGRDNGITALAMRKSANRVSHPNPTRLKSRLVLPRTKGLNREKIN